jgi:hypothetical protein
MVSIAKFIKFHFVNLFNWQLITCAAVLLLHLLISVGVIRLADVPGPAGVNDPIVICWMLIMGLVIVTPSFKYMLSQGVSRKRYFMAMGLNLVILAAIFALLSAVFYVITQQVANVWMIYELIYNNQNFLGIVFWEFGILLLMGSLAWLIRLVYYVSGVRAKVLVSVIPFVLASLLLLINPLLDGAIGSGLLQFLKAAMGLPSTAASPYIGMASMLAASVIISCPIYLLLRRAQVNNG